MTWTGWRSLLEDSFGRLGMRPGWVRDGERARASRMLTHFAEYVRQSRTAGRDLVGTEVELSAQVGRARIRGTADRLERDADGRLVIIDLKTGKSAPTAAELARNAQLGTYQLALERDPALADGAAGGAALVQLGTANKKVAVQPQRPLAEDDDPGWAAELVERSAEGMAAAHFPATVNPRCRTCEVRRSCPAQLEGRQVGR